ncbi:unnamed protein product [Rotaria socialis]|uniref:Type VII secretion system protein EssD-like domain-containing protein n=1 Tax=Rotaria socialis TaxID=392032 RepID=A0A818D0K4_9BILA|nr:unnamed protein product [Rotaria socialis]
MAPLSVIPDDGNEDGNPTKSYSLGPGGRVESVDATITSENLREGPRSGRGYSNDVGKTIRSSDGYLEKDEVGHLIGDAIGGPRNKIYNFIPQSPKSNKSYYNHNEKITSDYLKSQHEQGNDSAWVKTKIKLYYHDANRNRPTYISNSTEHNVQPHMALFSSPSCLPRTQQTSPILNSRTSANSVTCWRYHETGHYSSECPLNETEYSLETPMTAKQPLSGRSNA